MNAEIYLTERCNLNCSFCGAKGQTGRTRKLQLNCYPEETPDLSYENDILPFLFGLRKKGVRYVSLSGGEPFLYPKLREVIDIACSMGFGVNVTTNGTMIDEDYASFVSGRRVITRISLHTLDGDQFKEMTGGNLNRVLDSVNMLGKHKAMFAMGVTVSSENIVRIHDITEFGRESGACYIRAAPVFRVYKGSAYGTSCEEYSALIESVAKETFRNRDHLEYEPEQGIAAQHFEDIFLSGSCPAGSSYIALKPGRKLQACPVLPEYFMLPEKEYTCDADTGSFMKEYQRLIAEADTDALEGLCGDCIFKGKCRGGCISIKLSEDKGLLGEQPVCIYRIVRTLLDGFPLEMRAFLMNYWSLHGRKALIPGRTCIRQLPIWELHFKKEKRCRT